MTERIVRLKRRKKREIAFSKADSERLNNLAEEIKQLANEFAQPEKDKVRIIPNR